jgi:phosphopentomutase
MRAVLIVLDSVGIGAAPDAAAYGDEGAATLPHIGAAVGGLRLPCLQSLGLGNIPGALTGGLDIPGVPPAARPLASFGAMREVSEGKDTITGHWEIAGLEMNPGFRLFPPDPPSFPREIIDPFVERTGRGVLGNQAASGTAVIEALGPEQLETGRWIVYTSADSVFQIAAHTDVIPLDELYRGCEVARELCNPYRVGRVIARPYEGRPGSFRRTEGRRDYAYRPDEPTVLEKLHEAGHPVFGVGKIEDIFARRGLDESVHSGRMRDAQTQVARFLAEKPHGLIFANFIDYDMDFGHRRDPRGYAGALEQTDAWLAEALPSFRAGDLLILTADHGNDPTWHGTDHTRELVPLLAYGPGRPGRPLGLRQGFYDIAQTLAEAFDIEPMPRGVSFYRDLSEEG